MKPLTRAGEMRGKEVAEEGEGEDVAEWIDGYTQVQIRMNNTTTNTDSTANIQPRVCKRHARRV